MTSDGCESFSEILRQLNLKIQTRLLMVMLITLGLTITISLVSPHHFLFDNPRSDLAILLTRNFSRWTLPPVVKASLRERIFWRGRIFWVSPHRPPSVSRRFSHSSVHRERGHSLWTQSVPLFAFPRRSRRTILRECPLTVPRQAARRDVCFHQAVVSAPARSIVLQTWSPQLSFEPLSRPSLTPIPGFSRPSRIVGHSRP